MRNKKEIMSCVDASKVENYFTNLGKSIAKGCTKVWVRKERNGEMSFIVGNDCIRLSTSAIKEGGAL